ncbi:hypothetical protein PR003_g16613 [Phytophthora rubi]|uniref:RxLR effector protein n=1 Tax=Phytophthora rubi TaxID=129364 RepID=A0A6A4EVI6_9STRA|nr:hypothetical protein PR003_g16613 [Phytophthora rubi]
MRLSSLLLGVTALLLDSTNAAASIEETNTAQQVSGDKISASDDENRGKRFLRTDQGNKWDVEEDDEERVWNVIKLKKTDRLNTRLTSSVKVAAEKLKSGVTLRDIDRLNTRLSKSEKLPAKKSGLS